jgi:hypothetical protein
MRGVFRRRDVGTGIGPWFGSGSEGWGCVVTSAGGHWSAVLRGARPPRPAGAARPRAPQRSRGGGASGRQRRARRQDTRRSPAGPPPPPRSRGSHELQERAFDLDRTIGAPRLRDLPMTTLSVRLNATSSLTTSSTDERLRLTARVPRAPSTCRPATRPATADRILTSAHMVAERASLTVGVVPVAFQADPGGEGHGVSVTRRRTVRPRWRRSAGRTAPRARGSPPGVSSAATRWTRSRPPPPPCRRPRRERRTTDTTPPR